MAEDGQAEHRQAEEGQAQGTHRVGWAIAAAALFAVVLLLALALVVPTVHDPPVPTHLAAAHVHTRPPCTWPGRLLRAGMLRAAAHEYHALARRPHATAASRRCARRGIARVRLVRDQRAAALRGSGGQLGLRPTTIRRLMTAVRIERSADILPRVVAGGIARDGGSYGMRIAQALHRAHDNPEAFAVLHATLRRFPAATVPDELQGLGGAGLYLRTARALERAGLDAAAMEEVRKAIEADPTVHVPAELSESDRRLPLWSSVRGAIGPWLRTLGELLAALAIVAIVILAAILLRRQWRERQRRRMAIDAFRARGEGHGATTASSVRESYLRITRDAGGDRMRMVESSATDFANFDLPTGATDVIPAGRLVAAIVAFLQRLLPSTLWQVSGELQPPHPVRGAGLRLALRRGRPRAFKEHTFWENDYGPWPPVPDGEAATQENYDRLAVPAAAWLVFETTDDPDEPPSVLGADKWESYAQFAVGAEIQIDGDPGGARLRYHQALRYDGGNCGAAMNLAVADMHTATDTARHRRARDRLARLHEASRRDRKDPMWHRIRYNFAAAWLVPGRDPWPAGARELALDLCATIERQLAQDFAEDARLSAAEARARGRMRGLLKEVRPTALLLLASAMQQVERGSATGPPTPAELPHLLRSLQDGVDGDGLPLTHRRLVGHVLAVHEPLRPGARYNLACYYARVHDFASAERELCEALNQGDAALRRLALDDDVLDELLADPVHGEPVKQVLRELGVLAPVAPTTGARVRARLRRLGDLVLGPGTSAG